MMSCGHHVSRERCARRKRIELYRVAAAERLDVEEGDRFLRLEELEAGDFAWISL